MAIALVRMPGALEGDVARGIVYSTAVSQEVRTITGVTAVGWVSVLPIGRSNSQTLQIDTAAPGVVERAEVEVNVASAGYFSTMKIPLVEGRLFRAEDGALAPPVAVVNDVLARRYFGASAAGRRLRDAEGTSFEIVGVVGTGKYRTFQDAPEPMVYFPLSQRSQEFMHVLARTAAAADPVLPVLRQRLETVDRGVTIWRLTTFEAHLAEALTLDRLATAVVAACSLAAVLLATIGVYGVITDAIRRRTREIGLRVALGASMPQIVRLVFAEGLHLAAAGAVTGVLGALLLARVLRAFVFALPPLDLSIVAVVPVAVTLFVALAAVHPTRRALGVSPTVALRAD